MPGAPEEPSAGGPNDDAVPQPGVTASLQSQLTWYYARLFPADLMCRWLSYGDPNYLLRREISMTLPNDIYTRYRSFSSSSELRDKLKSQTPIKIDVGAVYNFPPRDKNSVTTPLVPQEKELVFDIDMTDYDDVIGNLAGGSETEKCDRNWRYMATAVKVLDTALREDFGFRHIMWVYSGRRGIHCWVSDQRARRMSNEQRVAVVEYLHLRFEGRGNSGRRQHEVTAPLHPSLSRAKRVACEATFLEFVLGEQGMLDTPERIEDLLSSIPHDPTRQALLRKLLDSAGGAKASPEDKWRRIEQEVGKAARTEYAVRGITDYIMFKHTYPRLDINVSRELNHLLKAPFCVHPKTGRVCVPFLAAEVDNFQPELQAPQISQLLAEMQAPGSASAQLTSAVDVLENYVVQLEKETRQHAKQQQLEELDKRNAMEVLAN